VDVPEIRSRRIEGQRGQRQGRRDSSYSSASDVHTYFDENFNADLYDHTDDYVVANVHLDLRAGYLYTDGYQHLYEYAGFLYTNLYEYENLNADIDTDEYYYSHTH